MKLSLLFKDAPEIEIENLMVDSRTKMPNSLFFCCKGFTNDGHRYVDQAIKNGAIAVVHCDELKKYNDKIIYIRVNNTQATLGNVASLFYNDPSDGLKVVGITGTNGKSSVACLIKSISEDVLACGYIGTIGIQYGDVSLAPHLTTPSVIELNEIFCDMIKHNMDTCALEVSSIGVDQGRVEGINFELGIFTNFTHDHLDYHGTMDHYFESKKRFFDQLDPSRAAIINVDDPYGMKIVKNTFARVLTYGIENEADYRARDIQIFADKTVFTLSCFSNDYRIETNLVARFNILNLLAAIAALHQMGLSIDSMLGKLNNLKQIEGRMERIEEGQPFNVIIDFAHTPDGLKKIFEFATKITPVGKRIIAVFGSAGQRDTKKRPEFGMLADKYCDMIILTEDDPRNESVTGIANDIAVGIKKTNYIVIESRYDAIRQAIEMSNIHDTILILGKGSETFMYGEFSKEAWIGDPNAVKEILHKYYFESEE